MPNDTSPIKTVSQLVSEISHALDQVPGLRSLAVRGEITNWMRARSGHCYFSLKDEQCQVRCVMFAGVASRLRRDFRPGDGAQVRLGGTVTVYEPRGELQVRVAWMEPDGLGELFVRLERLKQALAAEGLFAEARKRPLPWFPRVVGVVTSSDGAVLHDIRTTLARRNPAVQLLLAPSAVQGAAAEGEIVAGLLRLQARPEVECIIVGRGGGSLEDLMAFNSEAVVRAVAACPVPVISAVGHETDVTLCDLAADRRAPTPTAAAELAAPDRSDLLRELETCRQRLRSGLLGRLHREGERLERLRSAGPLRFPLRRVEREAQVVDALQDSLRRAALRRIQGETEGLAALVRLVRLHHPRARARRELAEVLARRKRLAGFRERMVPPRQDRLLTLRTTLLRAAEARLAEQRQGLEALRGRLQALSPLHVLDRGYALVTDPAGRVLSGVAQTRPGDRVRVRLRDGTLGATIEEVEEGTA